ncbi:E3 ubiquitin-protein ligase FANCL [Cephus cinctus]|uniref:E3 ubiquitin-protein ligase FANCL n=1 Tax=Cephus cinctus TaxID=211228 RepID=A0AAJ7FF61_CEPCN|nr:E3 ubiquitin-protein ligase FANCL [Cephus cinctus]
MDGVSEVLRWHPGLALVSESPFTWDGLLNIPWDIGGNQCTRIRIKFIVPEYPYLNDAKLYFGPDVTLLHHRKFDATVQSLLRSASTVSSFLRQLQMHACHIIKTKSGICHGTTAHTGKGMLDDLKNALNTPSDVQLSSNSNLDLIKLTLKDVSIVIRRNSNSINPWEIVTSYLPEIPGVEPLGKNVSSLLDIRKKFQMHVQLLEKTWHTLFLIDRNFHVIDPLEPKHHHFYRRIYLSQILSVLITIDPLHPNEHPHIKLMGCNTETEKYTEIISKNLENWDPENDIIQNLLSLLNLTEFPQPPIDDNKDKGGIVNDDECCICFSYELDNEQAPEKICDNRKCKRRFHTLCLRTWLQGVAGNEIVFDHICGKCPNCGENISCSIPCY